MIGNSVFRLGLRGYTLAKFDLNCLKDFEKIRILIIGVLAAIPKFDLYSLYTKRKKLAEAWPKYIPNLIKIGTLNVGTTLHRRKHDTQLRLSLNCQDEIT